ncbi:MAG: protein kinase domain-containing protein [Planctomycetota bacterium]|jgi:serine/threonine protein kinase
MLLTPGTQLGPYQIVGPLGAGGMGEVFRARDTRLDRDVAIKVLARHLSGDPGVLARFEREAKTISSLNHPRICTLYDVGSEGDTDYLVMELIEGETLAERIKKGPLPAPEVLKIGEQIADALDRAHRAGVIHRDVKPGNVMLTRTGAKLMDFGLARASSVATGEVASSTTGGSARSAEPLTAEGTILGTFVYMAPEQLEGEEADARSDLWALGCVLYEMATGRRAFDGKSKASLIGAIMHSEAVPIGELAPLSPPGLDRLVKACLAKDPADRLQSAHDLRLQLAWLAEGGSQAGVPAPVARRRRSRARLAWALVALLAVVAATAGWVAWRELSAPDRLYKFNIVPPKGIDPVFSGEAATCLTISPDGNWITFSARDEKGRNVLWLRRLDETEPRAIDGSDEPSSPFWSPDSAHVAFFSGGKLKKASVSGTPPLNLCDVQVSPRAGSWNEDGVIIFSPSSLSVIHRIPAAGGTPEPLTELAEDKVETTHRWATFLPDGNHFLYMAGSHTTGLQAEGNAIYASSLDDPKQRKLVFKARSNAVYSLGHLLYVRDNVLVAQEFDEQTLELTGDPFPVVDGVTYSPSHFRALFTVAEANGMLVYYPGSADVPLEMVRLDRNGREVAQIGDPAFFRSFRVSPDGRRIAMAILDRATGYTDIWIHDVERNVRSRFTFGPLDEGFPLWSPDGSTLYFSMNEDLLPDIYRRRLTGTAAEELVVKGEGWMAPGGISADGRWLAYVSVQLSAVVGADVLTLDLEAGGDPVPFLADEYSELGGAFSPDGTKLLYVSDATGRAETYVATFPVPARRWQISSDGGSALEWTSDGNEILFQSDEKEVMSVRVEDTGDDLVIGAPEVLFESSRYETVHPTRDGQAFYVTKRPMDTGTDTITFVSDWMAVAKPGGR